MSTGPLVLVVEDNERNLKLARDLLGVTGFRVVGAETAEAGLILARAERPDLILMDIQLPGMDGFAALRSLRGDPATAGLRVVAFTASVMKEDVDRIGDAGFDGYLGKPISVREFPSQVRAFCVGAADD